MASWDGTSQGGPVEVEQEAIASLVDAGATAFEPGSLESDALALERVRVSYITQRARGRRGPERFVAVRDATFSVRRRELVSLIGPSGCGKSTLLRAVGGLVPFRGSISVNGSPVRGPGTDRGIVFQSASLLPWRTVARNISYGLELQHAGKREIAEAVERVLHLVGLSDFRDAYPSQLSGGMQQRVNLARGLVVDPPVLLLDEPFAALDAQTRERLQIELLGIWDRTGKSGIFVTHQIDEAVLLGDRVVLMSPGPAARVAEVFEVPLGRPRGEEVRTNPVYVDTVQRIRKALDRFRPAEP